MSLSSETPVPPMILGRGQQRARILVAEDPFINSFLRTMLRRHGDDVVTGEPYYSADLMRAGSVAADVVITNTPQAFVAFADTLPIIYIAASPDPDLVLQFRNCKVLRKPFRNEELVAAVKELAHVVVP